MVKSDDVIAGVRAKAWHNVIGRYGDPVRMVLINKLVIHALNHFSSGVDRQSIAKPHRLIQESISTLNVSSEHSIEAQVPELVKAHEDKQRLAVDFPSLEGTSLLDFGSGNGYLGGWLSTLGVRYTGVEPSVDLHKAARGDSRLIDASLFDKSMLHFCECDLYPHPIAPTLITMIGVVDLLADPAASLHALFDFLARREWLNVPVLVATFDPDFFLPGLPVHEFVRQASAPYGVTETLGIRDPAAWEELFTNCGFHLLEQRPLHISGLPGPLSQHLHKLHEQHFARDPSVPDGGIKGGDRISATRVPPRQGPFYLWLLCPRNAAIEQRTAVAENKTAIEPHQIESFTKDEVLSVIGNLGPRVFQVLKGRALFKSPQTGPMPFGPGSSFGQMEAACNYVSSRVFGELIADTNSQLLTTNSRQILRQLTVSSLYSDKLFLSLLRHLDSVRFKSFVTAKRIDDQTSRVLTGKSYSPLFVSNIAACLLQACAKVIADAGKNAYRSRILVELTEGEMGEFIYGQDVHRETDKLLEILPVLVGANVIDTFSPYLLASIGVHLNIEEFDEISGNEVSALHIGLHAALHAARFIHHYFPPQQDASSEIEELSDLAMAISAFLGFSSDRDTFRTEWIERQKAERRSNKQAQKKGASKTQAMPTTSEDRREYALGLVACSNDDRERLRCFLNKVRSGFNYNEQGNFARRYGLSRFIVVRDIWALIACLLDRDDMWKSTLKVNSARDYMASPEAKLRIIAYIQECIAHAGRQSGFDICPW